MIRTLDPSYMGYDNLFTEYKTPKATVTMLSAIYAVKYGPEGFLVSSACPGLCATKLTGEDFEGAQPPAEKFNLLEDLFFRH